MNDGDVLIEAARAVSAETVESEVHRVAAEGVRRLLRAESAGWVATTADADAGLLALAEEASASRRPVVREALICIPVLDEAAVHGVLFARRPTGSPEPNEAELRSVESLASFVAVSLKNVTLFSTLETLVAQEMTHVVEREASMQLVLDSMVEGLLVCDVDGTIGPIRSRAVLQWFGEPAPGTTLDAYLGDPVRAPWIAIGFQSFTDAYLPFDLVADQMPRLITRDERSYRLGFQPVTEDERVSQVVVTIRDVTAELAQARADRINGELPTVVGLLVRDRSGFQALVEESSSLFLRATASESLTERQRIVHTLKGNALTYGFSVFGDACHALEDRVAEDPAQMTAEALVLLEREWTQALGRVSMFLTEDETDTVRLAGSEYESVIGLLERRTSHEELLRLVRGWRHPKVAAVVASGVSSAKQLAVKLRKQVEVIVDDGGLRLPTDELRSFFATLIHVFRNAIDHGIESPAERTAAGKAPVGQIHVQALVEQRAFIVRVHDDGRGIDWSRVRGKALAMGLPAATERDLSEALFSDGMSTRVEVTTVSGRGVGLSAVRARCQELGGTWSLRSEPGRGTTFEFAFALVDGSSNA